MLIGDIARLNASRYKDKLAFKDNKRKISFNLANNRMNSFIRALYTLGLEKGDRVAVLLYNRAEYCELLYGLPKGGFVIVPMNYRLIGRELTYIIQNSESKVIIYEKEFADTINEIKKDLPKVKYYILLDYSSQFEGEAFSYEGMIADHSSEEVNIKVTESDLAFILYTSGTTGFPKGAMLSHKNIFTNLVNAAFARHIKNDDVLFNIPPLYHCAAQTEMFVWSFHGCSTLILKQFDTDAVLDTLRSERPNIVMMVPAMLNMVINHPRVSESDFSFVSLILYGASSMMRSHLIKAMELFHCQFLQTAGLTEASPCLTFLAPEDHIVEGPDHITKRLSSAGKEAKLTEVRIIDSEGNECPPGKPGEEVARGDNIMMGYWKNPEETDRTIRDGWLHTGDICIKDEYGYIYYVDRIKDMICRGGENVYPREIEEVISGLQGVMEVAVIGVPDDRLQEEIMAIIALKENHLLDEKEVIAFCEKKLARFKKPRYVTFVDHLPKTASGKILKRKLKEQYRNIPHQRKKL